MYDTAKQKRLEDLLLCKKKSQNNTFSEFPPTLSTEGDVWLNTVTSDLFIQYQGSWVKVGYEE